MNITFLSPTHNQAHRLLLLFSGWGCDESIARGLERHDYDLAVAYSYSGEPTAEALAHLRIYGELIIVAWSYGVTAATLFMHAHPELPVTLKIAVNGTHTPVDTLTGISPEIFHGTLRSLSEASLLKFRRRMCGSRDAFSRYMAEQCPERSIDSLRAELAYLGSLSAADVSPHIWDVVYISTADMIIPTASQQRFWTGHTGVKSIDAPHLPDFRTIIDANVVDKLYLSQRFENAKSTYDRQAVIQRHVAARLAELIAPHLASLPAGDALEIGCGSGLLTHNIAPMLGLRNLTLWDLAAIDNSLPGKHCSCDAESAIRILPDSSLTFIASASTIQWFDSPAHFIRQCARVLRPGGMLAIATYEVGTYASVTPFISGTMPRYYTPQWWRTTLSSHFSIKEIHCEHHTMQFDSAIRLARHMSGTGVNASAPSPSALRQLLKADVRTLDYKPIYIIAIAQPKSNL